MSNVITKQIPKNLLFRYRIACRYAKLKASEKFELDETHQLQNFGGFEGQEPYADVRAAWNEKGLFFSVEVTTKKQSLWCRENQLMESDGVQLWIDTRDTHNVHRATRFCHWFAMLPSGGGAKQDKPVISTLKINRSREDSPAINRAKLKANSSVTKKGYRVTTYIPSEALNGWNVDDHRQLGFNYAITDRELGWQTLAIGPELPIAEDPALWQTLHLVD
jgi:hypothetical protein